MMHSLNSTPPTPDRRPPITPQLALRVAVFGAIALGLFAIIFFRLWYLQVLSGDEYLAEANQNRVRELRVPAPRGEIVDRDGRVIVENRRAVVVQVDPSELPDVEREMAAEWGQRAGQRAARPKGRRGKPVAIPATPPELVDRFERLGGVLNISPREIQRRVIRALAVVPYSAARVDVDVPFSVLTYIAERPKEFPGVEVEPTFLRAYPKEELAAQILGTVGEVSPEELDTERFREVRQGTVVGKGGLERTYDRYLRGTDGVRRVQIDAFGRPIGTTALRATEPVAGQRLKLSIDLELQEMGQAAMKELSGGQPGAFVALDPRDGQVLAMGSNPSFDPDLLAKPITQEEYDERFGEEAGSPQVNRVIAGVYPIGSTFKAVTALAALESGAITPAETINDAGCERIGDREFCNAKKTRYGAVDMGRSLEVSSDIYYYRLGLEMFFKDGQVLQSWARKLGYGRPTGIDLADEFDGVVPDREWRDRLNDEEKKCRPTNPGRQPCFVVDIRDYNGGDNVNLSVGQGDLQATPLQLAVSYAAIANGGKVPRPHLGLEIEDGQGRLIQRIERDPARRVRFSEATRTTIMDGLRRAAQGDEGTSSDVFGDWPHDRFPVFGKTGTVERDGQEDQSWYVSYVPSKTRPIVVVATVEKGGFGAETAAPIVRLLLSKHFGVTPKVVRGKSTDA